MRGNGVGSAKRRPSRRGIDLFCARKTPWVLASATSHNVLPLFILRHVTKKPFWHATARTIGVAANAIPVSQCDSDNAEMIARMARPALSFHLCQRRGDAHATMPRPLDFHGPRRIRIQCDVVHRAIVVGDVMQTTRIAARGAFRARRRVDDAWDASRVESNFSMFAKNCTCKVFENHYHHTQS